MLQRLIIVAKYGKDTNHLIIGKSSQNAFKHAMGIDNKNLCLKIICMYNIYEYTLNTYQCFPETLEDSYDDRKQDSEYLLKEVFFSNIGLIDLS